MRVEFLPGQHTVIDLPLYTRSCAGLQYATEILYNNRAMTTYHHSALLMVCRISHLLFKEGIAADRLTNRSIIRLTGYARTLAEWYCTWCALLIAYEKTAFRILEKETSGHRSTVP
jgi:hypothetical protein